MKSRITLLYIPLVLLFVFAAAVMVSHLSKSLDRLSMATVEYNIPFTADGNIVFVQEEGYKAGLRVNDRLIAINGRPVTESGAWRQEMDKSMRGEPFTLTVGRKVEGGEQALDVTVVPTKIERNLQYFMKIFTGFVFVYVMPLFCVLLGFWVALVRPRDPLAWLLLFVMMGVSAIGMEGGGNMSIVAAYQKIFGSLWAPSMMLFGIYFPERLPLDKKAPWLKWVLLAPLSYQVIVTLLGQLKLYTGIALVDYVVVLDPYFAKIILPLNVLSIGLFFACLGYKSGTLANPDARRRLKIMVIGSTIALTPTFLVIMYSIFTGKGGSFWDRVPWWLAFAALTLMLLFPITMAYVIVVHRAMDVSVVIRQGVQYALASNSVKILQLLLLTVVVFGVIFIARNFQNDLGAQIGFVAAGFALIPLIEFGAKRLKTFIDKRFFREAYNAEQILAELSEEVRTMVETRPLLETVSNKISESLHVPQVALLLRKGNAFEPAFALGYDTLPTTEIPDSAASISKLKKNEPVMIYREDAESWINEEADEGERARLEELNSQLLLPVGAKDELSGVISLSPKRSEVPYSANDLRLLRSVAIQTGLALENSRLTEAIANEAAQKERLNRELEIAREVQERLFPQELPIVDGLEYYGACRPALGVGGDYYDFIELEDGKLGIAIGDVSGKGIGASLMMASLQAALRGQAIHSGNDLAGLMERVNKLVYDTSTTNRYATFFHAQYDPKTRKLTYVNAGHNPPYILRRSSLGIEVIELKEGGAVVGMLPPMLVNYSQGEVELKPGDVLVGFTDGISEAMNPKEEEWGEDAVLEEMKTLDGLSCQEILEHIVAAADKFADGAKQHDDMTMIVLKVKK